MMSVTWVQIATLRLKKRTPAVSVRSIEAQREAAAAQPTSSPRPMTLTLTFVCALKLSNIVLHCHPAAP